MAWQAVLAALTLMGAAVLAPEPVQELPPAVLQEPAVPAPDGSQREWRIHTVAPAGPAAEGFARGVAMMQGVRGTLVPSSWAQADIMVRWHDELLGGQRMGQHTEGTGSIDVALGDSRCGTWRAYDARTISLVVAHEIGHAQGLAHAHDKSLMAERLPVQYVEPCTLATGSQALGPLRTLTVPFTLGAPREVAFEIDSDRSVDACLVPAQARGMTGWACTGGRHAHGSAALGDGRYELRVRCGLLPCDVAYTLQG